MSQPLSDGVNCICYTYEQLAVATKNFTDKSVADGGCKLGEGGFGPVFRGKLLYTTVAIKKLRQENANLNSKMAQDQFHTELATLTRYRHPNLVTLIGYSSDHGQFCLVYEFMSNGTLEDALADSMAAYLENEKHPESQSSSGKRTLPWEVRMSIAMDTARGLLYLHTADKKNPLVHRDVKSANVLLDVAYRAKLGDFGLARPLSQDNKAKTKHVVGTSGYIPPEYYRGTITTKMDSYGYGVVLLEIMTGKSSYDSNTNCDLTTEMQPYIFDKKGDHNNLMIIADESAGRWPSVSFIKLCKTTKKCLEDHMADRCEIKDIYEELQENLREASHIAYTIEKKKSKKFIETPKQ